jgi:hypothetical protein
MKKRKNLTVKTKWEVVYSHRKGQLNYREQRERWNDLQAEFRKKNKGLNKIKDMTGEPLDLYSGVYTD